MIPQNQVQWRTEPAKSWNDAIVTTVVMIDHISQLEYGIQRLGIELPNATVKFFEGFRVMPDSAYRAIAVLAIGKDSDPDGLGSLRINAKAEKV